MTREASVEGSAGAASRDGSQPFKAVPSPAKVPPAGGDRPSSMLRSVGQWGLWFFAATYWLGAAAVIASFALPYVLQRLGLAQVVYATAYQIDDASSCAQNRLGIELLSTKKPLLSDDVDEAEVACEDEVIIRQQLKALGKTRKHPEADKDEASQPDESSDLEGKGDNKDQQPWHPANKPLRS